jgi:branched-chain amino acid transport system ATP-binding protein
LVRDLERYDALQTEAKNLLEDWGLRHQENVPVKLLSYGQRRLIEIVLALAIRPQVLLLDEPAAGLSGAETKLIIEAISALDAQLSILIVEHDMDLVFAVCDRVTVIANGKVLAEGTGDQIRGDKAVVEAYLGMPL